MTKQKQIEEMRSDLVEIFDEEYEKRRLITPQNTADKLYAKGYRKASELAEEIIDRIDEWFMYCEEYSGHIIKSRLAELKKKYTEEQQSG